MILKFKIGTNFLNLNVTISDKKNIIVPFDDIGFYSIRRKIPNFSGLL